MSRIDDVRAALKASRYVGDLHHTSLIREALVKLSEIESELKELRRKDMHRVWGTTPPKNDIDRVLDELTDQDAIPRPVFRSVEERVRK